MLRLVLGILVGVVLCAGSGWLYLQKGKDCLSRCGDGTRCFEGKCIPSGPSTSVATTPSLPKKHKRHGGGSGNNGSGPAAPELHLSPGDDHMTASGDALGRPEHIDLSQGGDDGKALSQDDLDAVFHPAQSAITHCITDAVGDYPLESGKISVAFRVERSGAVKKLRVEAPQLLMRRGLFACVKPIVTGLSFPASGGANVVTYPFALQ